MSTAVVGKPAFGLPGRIQEPNSRRRSIALVGLGSGGAAVARAISKQDLAGLDVRVAYAASSPDALDRIKNHGDEMTRAVRDADMIFMVACRGDDVSLAPVVSRIAHGHNAPVTAIYLVPAAGFGPDDATLRTLRTGAEMMVIASDESYVAAMVAALGG